MWQAAEVQDIVEGAIQGATLQMFLGAPFLLHNAGAYVSRAFELSRVFKHVWSVNLKFLPEPVFQSRSFASALLAAHLALLLLFAHFRSAASPENRLKMHTDEKNCLCF